MGGDPKLTFSPDAGFHREVKRRVGECLRDAGLSPRDSPRMFLKTAVILLWFGASYAMLVFVAATWWQGALASLSLALAMAGIGFAVQHDANHGAYSRHPAVNRLVGMSLDLLGGSSYVWRFKHNVSHHTYTNLAGADDDINLAPLARLSPAQARLPFHRFQQLYLWPMYGAVTAKWHFVQDFKNIARGRVGRSSFPRPRGRHLAGLIAGKALFFGWAFVLPALFHPWWVVLLFYAATSFVLGVVLSVIFVLAHCVEEADFPEASPGDRLDQGWAVHQVRTTVDFARRNRLLTWYLGGLNYQIEHHLFPRICHVHYPRIAPIVEAVSREFGLPYTAHATLSAAVASHYRWLRKMGTRGRLPGRRPGSLAVRRAGSARAGPVREERTATGRGRSSVAA